MGQPRFSRKNYDTPSHPWQGERIKAENEVKTKFGLKNKREIWKAQTRLREIRGQARGLISRTRNPADTQAGHEAKLLVKRLHREGFVGDEATLNDVLGLDVERILGRRLQSQVYLKGLARTPKQARQFISHGCILIGQRRVTVPSYVVRRAEEDQIVIDPSKALADEAHPVRPKPAGYEAVEEAPPTPRGPGSDDAAGEPAKAEDAAETKATGKAPTAPTPAETATTEAPKEAPAEEAKAAEDKTADKDAPKDAGEEKAADKDAPKDAAEDKAADKDAPKDAAEDKAADKDAPKDAGATEGATETGAKEPEPPASEGSKESPEAAEKPSGDAQDKEASG